MERISNSTHNVDQAKTPWDNLGESQYPKEISPELEYYEAPGLEKQYAAVSNKGAVINVVHERVVKDGVYDNKNNSIDLINIYNEGTIISFEDGTRVGFIDGFMLMKKEGKVISKAYIKPEMPGVDALTLNRLSIPSKIEVGKPFGKQGPNISAVSFITDRSVGDTNAKQTTINPFEKLLNDVEEEFPQDYSENNKARNRRGYNHRAE